MFKTFKHKRLLPLVVANLLFATSVQAADCYADYKAKMDDPLRLHYGVIELKGACDKSKAKGEISKRIGRDGWALLNVVSVFDASKLQGKRSSAGQFFLRY